MCYEFYFFKVHSQDWRPIRLWSDNWGPKWEKSSSKFPQEIIPDDLVLIIPSGAQAGIFLDKKANTLAADAWLLCVVRSSATMILAVGEIGLVFQDLNYRSHVVGGIFVDGNNIHVPHPMTYFVLKIRWWLCIRDARRHLISSTQVTAPWTNHPQI